ncbi:MAG: hypothetical protein RLZZ499_1247, partial [Cyanobacteriota bacterium]
CLSLILYGYSKDVDENVIIMGVVLQLVFDAQ